MNKAKNKLALSLLFLLIIFSLTIGAYKFYKSEYVNNPITKESLKLMDFGKIYDFHVARNPDITGRSYYGSENASITMIAYLDNSLESSKYFLNNILPDIKKDFIQNGKLKLYIKSHITMEDVAQKNNKFLYAVYLVCFESIKKENRYGFYLNLSKLEGHSQTPELMVKYGITEEILNKCLKENSFDEINIDALEVENFGMSGTSPRFYIGIDGEDNTILEGVPAYLKFNRTIKQYEFSIGS